MTFIKPWLKFANYDEIKAEAARRGMFPSTLPPAIIYKEVGWEYIANILPKIYHIPDDQKEYYTRIYLLDTKYYLTSIDEVRRFLEWNAVDKEQYQNDIYDCDNFASSLWADAVRWTPGIALGHFHTLNHAKNLVVCSDDKAYEIEPQSDVVTELKSEVSFYMI